MKQPAKRPGGQAARPKIKRKTREELNLEAKERKRQKKHRGHASGSRTQESESGRKSGGAAQERDPRLRSKKRVPLTSGAAPQLKPEQTQAEAPRKLSPQEELEMLESDSRLDELLDRLERGETLPAKDQSWVDEKLDRIDLLMEQLGIELDDDDDEEEREEDMLQLLKRGNPKDGY